ncbi:Tyrosine-protein phosphatase Lar-like protein, partial [Leptotrombidium deliense]
SAPTKVKTQQGVPSQPKNLRAVATSATTVQLTWKRPSHSSETITGYEIYWNDTFTNIQSHKSIPDIESYSLGGLNPSTVYNIWIAAKSRRGEGVSTPPILMFTMVPELPKSANVSDNPQDAIDTDKGTPKAPPHNITSRLQNPTAVVLTWDPPLLQYRNGRISGYGVQFNKVADYSSTQHNTTQTRIVFNSLDENSEYVFRVCAYTSKGSGPWSSPMQVITPKDFPPATRNLQAIATSEQSVEVWWYEVPFFKDILGYQVLYSQSIVEDLDLWQKKIVPLTLSAELTGLEGNTAYAIRVAAYTNQGIGRFSEIITVRTKPEFVPLKLTSRDITTHSMTIAWK